MRARSDCDTWARAFTATPSGPGTKRPYAAVATLPVPDRAALDCIAAIWYRYRTIHVRMVGSFSFSSGFEFQGDDWSVALSGSYTVSSTSYSGGAREGDRYLYPSGGGRTPPVVDFTGSCLLINETTGDEWGTDKDPPQKLHFLGQDNGTVTLFRGSKIEILGDLQSITTEFYAEGGIGVSCKSTTSDSPRISTIFSAQRFTSNEDGFYTVAGDCTATLHNIYGGFQVIPCFGDPHTETPIIVFSSGPNSVELDGRADSQAAFIFDGGEVWPHGVDPDAPISFTTLNALWAPDGTPTRPIADILNASLTEA